MKKFIREHFVSVVLGITFLASFIYSAAYNNYQVDVFVFLFVCCMLIVLIYDKEKNDEDWRL